MNNFLNMKTTVAILSLFAVSLCGCRQASPPSVPPAVQVAPQAEFTNSIAKEIEQRQALAALAWAAGASHEATAAYVKEGGTPPPGNDVSLESIKANVETTVRNQARQ
ncbi:MAG: hypothetical protein P4N60_15985 [Verrucomicrobiae bacterium]|nr:hypothetical protein [Verrucomicrobiae bacterium]